MKQYRITLQSPVAFLLLTLLLSITACTSTEVEIEHKVPPVDNTNGIEATLHFNILSTTTPQTRCLTFTQRGTLGNTTEASSATSLDGLSLSLDKPINTKADLPESETKLYTIWCGQYDMAGNLIAAKYSENVSSENSVQLQLTKSTDENQLYLVANTGNLSDIAQGKSLSDFRKLTANTAVTASGQLTSNKCMMTGLWTGIISGSINGQIDLTRSVAKIVFTYTVGTGVQNFSFTPTSLKLCDVPDALQYDKSITQLTNINYITYTSRFSTGTYTWYLPENRAGIAAGAEAVSKDADKTGNGVTNATYICLTGDVTQNNVTYNDVTFRLYPGGDENGVDNCNNYNINRNYIYTLDVTLTGIDFTDKRVTVNVPEMVSKIAFDAVKGDVRDFQITVQPGVAWTFQMPGWLSALIDGTTVVNPENVITHSGPARIQLTTTSTNPNAEPFETIFDVDNKTITVTQEGSEFNVDRTNFILFTDGTTRDTAKIVTTADLLWTVDLTGGNQSITSQITRSKEDHTLFFKAQAYIGTPLTATYLVQVTNANPPRGNTLQVKQYGGPPDGSIVLGAPSLEMSPTGAANNSYTEDVVMPWEEGRTACENMHADGYTDWRLPTLDELKIIYYKFSQIESGYQFVHGGYWSSTSAGDQMHYIRFNALLDGSHISLTNPKSSPIYVRCVRDVN